MSVLRIVKNATIVVLALLLALLLVVIVWMGLAIAVESVPPPFTFDLSPKKPLIDM